MTRLPASRAASCRRGNQRGVVMVSAILLLAVLTIFALSMFRSFGIEEKIASNVRDKERALHSAMSALQYAEWWLAQPGNDQGKIPCAGGLLDANAGQGQLCDKQSTLQTMVVGANVGNVPWIVGGVEAGVKYRPPTMLLGHAGGIDTYYEAPRFYIQWIGHLPPPICGDVFLVDAWGYGGSKSSVAVVESTFRINVSDCSNTGG